MRCCASSVSKTSRDQRVAELAYGKRRLLEIAMALACRPRVLLLDEPVAGVPEGERQEILDIVNALPAEVSVLLIEHDMDLVFNFARRVTVLVNGAIFAEGDAATVAADPRVMAVYLGEGASWLSCSASRTCAPATARPSSSRVSASRSTRGSRWHCSAATAPARRRCSTPWSA